MTAKIETKMAELAEMMAVPSNMVTNVDPNPNS
jgi:hypothetical protein